MEAKSEVKSKAFEINLALYHVDVDIDPKYLVLQRAMSSYHGIMEGLNAFLTELSHPRKNWQILVREARSYSLDYFHLLKKHPEGPDAASLFADIYFEALQAASSPEVKADAADNLTLFLQKVIRDSGAKIERFRPVLDLTFDRIRGLPRDDFNLFARSVYPLKNLGKALLEKTGETSRIGFRSINRLLRKYFRTIYKDWLKEEDPRNWFQKEVDVDLDTQTLDGIFREISHEALMGYRSRLEEAPEAASRGTAETLRELLSLPGYNQIAQSYGKIPHELLHVFSGNGRGHLFKVIFLFHTMNISGLSLIHEEALREINRTLSWLIAHESRETILHLIRKTFSILRSRIDRYPQTVLSSVLSLGRGVYRTDDRDLIDCFIDHAIDLTFQAPMVGGVGDDWQIKANAAHIQNIRIWLELMELNPKRSTRLLSALIIYLSLCGVFIKDTDLFPREITRLLNSPIAPVYNLVKQLSRLLPTFFNDIGAEGLLRDISTRIDEVTRRSDVLIHFLRKQSHVESSNRIIDFMEATLHFWLTRNKKRLKPYVPPYIHRRIETSGPHIDGVHRIVSGLKEDGFRIPQDFLTLSEKKIKSAVAGISGASPEDRERVGLAVSFYRLLNQKYTLNSVELDHYLEQLRPEAFPGLDRLREAIAEKELKKKISMFLEYMEMLKERILSPDTHEIREDIYKKRHFAMDIPSMYGSYHEMKFDALGLTLRIESLLNVLLEDLIDEIDLSLITKATFFQIQDYLKLFERALRVDGIVSPEIERQLEFLANVLEMRGISLTQYIDIFKGFALAVKNIITDLFDNLHEPNLTRILSTITPDRILPRYLPGRDPVDGEKLRHRVSEIFFRDRITFSLGLQQLDLFLSRILSTLFRQLDRLPKDKLQQLLLYDPKRAMTGISQARKRVLGIIYLGNKGINLVKLKACGLPIPPGFIITTEVFRFREIIQGYRPALQNFKEGVSHHIGILEKETGKTFGDPKNPLLLSARSGSSISQPGMMDTFLDVGMNEEIAAGLAATTQNAWFAWDNYRRFLQCYGMAFGLERDQFDAIIGDCKRKAGVPFKKEFTGEQMRQVALAYKTLILDSGIEIEETPREQLHVIIGRVFASWDSKKAKAYRKIMGISDDWGTAVTVQAMVFGNISPMSGTGVIFTHNPRWSEDSIRLRGDFTLENQGEDVVSGLVRTLPISLEQQEIEMRETDVTLETHFPEIYTALRTWSEDLINQRGWSPMEMEFTFESPSAEDLYVLQARDMAMRKQKELSKFDLDQGQEEKSLGHGIGVSGGAMGGRAVFSLEEINSWREKEPETSLILVRGDTVPDDIREIHAADGLLTARGGLTSHAAVVAHRLGKTCVVGCSNMVCNEKDKTVAFNQMLMKSGDFISIDGQEGSVYRGHLKVVRH